VLSVQNKLNKLVWHLKDIKVSTEMCSHDVKTTLAT